MSTLATSIQHSFRGSGQWNRLNKWKFKSYILERKIKTVFFHRWNDPLRNLFLKARTNKQIPQSHREQDH